jgi:hypothetical protein
MDHNTHPSRSEHEVTDPYAVLLAEWAAERFKVDATEIVSVELSYSDEYGRDSVHVSLVVSMRDDHAIYSDEDELESIGELLTALVVAMNKGGSTAQSVSGAEKSGN